MGGGEGTGLKPRPSGVALGAAIGDHPNPRLRHRRTSAGNTSCSLCKDPEESENKME